MPRNPPDSRRRCIQLPGRRQVLSAVPRWNAAGCLEAGDLCGLRKENSLGILSCSGQSHYPRASDANGEKTGLTLPELFSRDTRLLPIRNRVPLVSSSGPVPDFLSSNRAPFQRPGNLANVCLASSEQNPIDRGRNFPNPIGTVIPVAHRSARRAPPRPASNELELDRTTIRPFSERARTRSDTDISAPPPPSLSSPCGLVRGQQ